MLSSQSGAAFLAAAFDDQTAGTGSHAGEESDTTFAAAVRGLECSFHLSTSIFLCFNTVKINLLVLLFQRILTNNAVCVPVRIINIALFDCFFKSIVSFLRQKAFYFYIIDLELSPKTFGDLQEKFSPF